MEKLNYISISEDAINRIKSDGAFLNIKSKDNKEINVMTIGWTAIGYMWRKPIMIVMVRKSRFTHHIIENACSFTVSVPISNLKDALDFCGTKSGRDFNKFKEVNLSVIPAQKVNTPIINTPGFHFECKIVYKSKMNPELLCSEYKEDVYPDNDYHSFYFGEIVDCYKL